MGSTWSLTALDDQSVGLQVVGAGFDQVDHLRLATSLTKSKLKLS